MAKKIILISDFKEEHFNFLVDCYDKEFKRRLTKEMQDIKSYYMKIKHSLTTENLNIIKDDYIYIDEIMKCKNI
jgi:predicted solute-binding protein